MFHHLLHYYVTIGAICGAFFFVFTVYDNRREVKIAGPKIKDMALTFLILVFYAGTISAFTALLWWLVLASLFHHVFIERPRSRVGRWPRRSPLR